MENNRALFEFAEGQDFVSLFIKDRRFEIELKPFLGNDYKLMGLMWEMSGTKRVHLYSIKYGQTQNEIEEQLNQVIHEYNTR